MEWEDFNVRAGFVWITSMRDRRCPAIPQSRELNSRSSGVCAGGSLGEIRDLAASGDFLSHRRLASLHFAYGHFRQFPAIARSSPTQTTSVLANLQAGGVDYGVLGNPDVRAGEKRCNTNFGFKQVLNENMGLDVTTFYKDIRDLFGVEFVSTYNGAEYARLTNVDLGDVIGVTVAFDARRIGRASIGFDYTWQQALGNSSDPRETATRASAGEDPQPRIVPFVWDQRHTVNLTASIDLPNAYSASAILRAASGQPYTPVFGFRFQQRTGNELGTQTGRLHAGSARRKEISETASDRRWPCSHEHFNLFDTRYYNGFVFDSTGSPYYSRFPETTG
jgi:hypothetical protein